MLIKFWIGLSMSFVIAILLMIVLGWLTKRMKKNAAIGALIGFFLGFALVMLVGFGARRAYVVTGDAQYDHYMVFGSPEFETKAGTTVIFDMSYNECYVVNETEEPVVIEKVIYGGFSFGGNTTWVQPGEQGILSEHSIYYFYDNEPPEEINVKDDSEETVRLWLRNRRE